MKNVEMFVIVMSVVIAILIAGIIITAIKTHLLATQRIKLAKSEFNLIDEDDDGYYDYDEPEESSGYYYYNRDGQRCAYQAPIC